MSPDVRGAGGVQAINFSEAGKARTDSNALTDLGGTAVSIDTALFVSWLEAAEPELAGRRARNVIAVTAGEGLAPYLYQSFSERLRVAVDDWLRRPDTMGTTPFELDSYVVDEFVQAQKLRNDAADFGDAARGNNQQSDIYVLATVVFASALFLVGICQKLKRQTFQQAVFGVAVVVALIGACIVITQPIELASSDLGL